MRVLIIRLSSLGDVILAARVWALVPPSVNAEWLVASEFAEVLEGHPRITRVIRFDRRREGLLKWLSICRELMIQGQYDLVLDLHGSLRSRIAFGVYAVLKSFGRVPRTLRWGRLRKERWRLWGFYIFKNKWPQKWRPRPFMERVREWIPEEVTSRVRPIKDAELGASLGYLVAGEGHQHEVTEPRDGSSERPKTLGVMISASHPGKELPLRIALEILQSPRLREVELRVLGLPKDRMSQSLQSRLKDLGRLGVDEELKKKSIRETAREILRCDALLSVDTGILHLAEGLGVPVVGLYGPTHRDLGFPVVRSGSEALASSLWCRPCSKDGSMCFRKNRYLCMKETSVEQVVGALVRVLKLSTGAKP